MDSNKAICKYKKLLSDSSMYKLTGDMDIVTLDNYTVTLEN